MRKRIILGTLAISLLFAATASAKGVVVQRGDGYKVICQPRGHNAYGPVYDHCRTLMWAGNPLVTEPLAHASNYYWAWHNVPTNIVYANAGSGYKFYAQWECDANGIIVAIGISWVSDSLSVVESALIGGFVTRGCDVIWPYYTRYWSGGVPWSDSYCWNIVTQQNPLKEETECIV